MEKLLTPSKVNLDLDFEREDFYDFLKSNDLEFDSCDEAYAIREDGKIVATGAYEGNVLKLFASNADKREEGLIPKIVTHIKQILFEKGINQTFIFTKPIYTEVFKSLFYEELARTDKIVLLTDNMNDYYNWIDKLKAHSKYNACIVMNANPFTKGHRYIAEKAAMDITNIIVFVVEEDKSFFPFMTRLKMVEKGLEDIWLSVEPGGKYIISNSTFPSYFLKSTDNKSKEFAKLDADLFVGRIAKDLGIKIRYLGEENYDALTKYYNETLIERAKGTDLEIRVVPRLEIDGQVVSASYVREHLDEPELIEKFLPKTTIDILNEGGE
ncbi:MAG: adenylyltransferase/cytidyltransferase family protein [Ezakiella sp.]|nr:adenylyltransferase/cytidyltransferase family protein [Ezakiella sp.]